ncbi:MAG: aldo/keto reductase [Lachnospiraceae bacterium]|jgi:predicted aldo/keto reductase-like oxidoreductase|nr:aldo/keto reductase [Lachnospiraceae bacterium]MDD3616140.1 aldo/keto reductase [Lachnospiraceae bacterium]
MNYRNINEKEQVSILGFGCMRFSKKGSSVDIKKAEEEVLYAIRHGVNYFDTAYIYPGNEEIVGEIMARNNCRKDINIATKIPHYMIHSIEELEKYFNQQLKRLQTDYIDYYLMHMLPDLKIWSRLTELGILEWIRNKKSEGKIRNIGFSFHGNTQNFIELCDVYAWDFCQVQYNYMDEYSQAGRAGVEHAKERGIPVFIMEPLRGGRLVNALPPKAQTLFQEKKPNRSPAEWALRWLWNQDAVTMVLSGMNSIEMVQENIRIASESCVGELKEEDFRFYEQVKKAIQEKIKVPCTGCGYCTPCPKGVDIPGIFRCYNASYMDTYFKGFKEYVMCTTLPAKKSNASLCVECGKCEKHCPQGISIRKELRNVKKRMEHPVYKAAAWYIKKKMN